MKKSAFLVSLFVAAILLSACAPSSGTLIITDAWARPASAGENGAAYFIIENGTGADDTLLSVSSEIASATEVHMSMGDANGVMSMKMQESVPVPARENVDFKPGGLHVMLVGVKQDLNVGDMITLRLSFEKAGNIVIEVPIREL